MIECSKNDKTMNKPDTANGNIYDQSRDSNPVLFNFTKIHTFHLIYTPSEHSEEGGKIISVWSIFCL